MAAPESSAHQIEVVRQLIAAVREGRPRDPIAVTEAQERGFGMLMSMEAELQRAQRAARDAAGGPERTEKEARVQELKDAITELSDALTELRDVSSTGGDLSKVGYGFVLPSPRRPDTRKPG